MKNIKFGFPMADEKQGNWDKKIRLRKQVLLMGCKEMESVKTRKLNDRIVFEKNFLSLNSIGRFQEPKATSRSFLMKITSHKVTPIAFTDPPLRNAVGLHAPYGLRVILELAFEDGFTGISEAPAPMGLPNPWSWYAKVYTEKIPSSSIGFLRRQRL